MKSSRTSLLAAVLAAFAASAIAQQYVYPAKGQSPDQQKKDEAACHQWAVEQSKYDPANPPPAAAAPKPPTTATGTTPGAGARGAARPRAASPRCRSGHGGRRAGPIHRRPVAGSTPRR